MKPVPVMKLDLTRLMALPLLALITACSTPAAVESGEQAPYPYSAAQIRAANPEGTQLLYRVAALGSQPVLRRMTFIATDTEGATIENQTTGLHGEPIGGVNAKYSSWQALRGHASFPAQRTTRTEVTCEVAAGKYECWKYVVDEGVGQNGLEAVSRYWFAHSKPGPPVLMETDHSGVLVLRMELVEERRP